MPSEFPTSIDSLLRNVADNVSFGPGLFSNLTAPVSRKEIDEVKIETTNSKSDLSMGVSTSGEGSNTNSTNLNSSDELQMFDKVTEISDGTEIGKPPKLENQEEEFRDPTAEELGMSGPEAAKYNAQMGAIRKRSKEIFTVKELAEFRGKCNKYKTHMDRETMIDLLNSFETSSPIAVHISRLAHKICCELDAKNSGTTNSNSTTGTVTSNSKRGNNSNSGKKNNHKSRNSGGNSNIDLYKFEITFEEAAQRVTDLQLPMDPFEKYNLNEQRFHEVLVKYQHDPEIMKLAEKTLPLMHNGGQPLDGKTQAEYALVEGLETPPRKDLSLMEVCKVHEVMINILCSALKMFQELPAEVRHSYSSKHTETTAELLVSIGIQRKFKCISEDVEFALQKHESALARRQDFAASSQMLTTIMQQLTGMAKPRFSREKYKEYLKDLTFQAKRVKKHISETYTNMKSGKLSFVDAYLNFEAFTFIQNECMIGDIMPSSELKEHQETYRYKGNTNTSELISSSEGNLGSNTTNSTVDTSDEKSSVSPTKNVNVTGTVTIGNSQSSSTVPVSDLSKTAQSKTNDQNSKSTMSHESSTKSSSLKKDSSISIKPSESEDEEIIKLWEESGAEVQTIMHIAALCGPLMGQMGGMMPGGGPPGIPQMPTTGPMASMAQVLPIIFQQSTKEIGNYKQKMNHLTPNDVVEMQNFMVGELRDAMNMFKNAVNDGNCDIRFTEQILMGFVQALGSTSVEKKYKVGSEEMAIAGFLHAPALGGNQNFIKSTMEQQEVMMQMAQAIQDYSKNQKDCCIM